MLTQLRTRNLFKAKLSRYVASWVFVSIVLIEIVILVPSYFRQRQQLLSELEEVSYEVLAPLLTKPEYQSMRPDQILEKVSRRRQPNSVILGGALYTPSGQLIGTFGEKPEVALRDWGNTEVVRQYNSQRDRYDVVWTAKALDSKYILVVRHDATQVATELNGFIVRIALLVMVIAIFVTLTTMLTFGLLVITPILRLRDDLIAAGEAISQDLPDPDFQSLKTQRQDKLGEVMMAFNQMFQRVRQEISTRRKAETQLRAEQEKAERLLLNVLPAEIAEQLKQNHSPIASRFDEVTILFADIVRFTELSARIPPVELVNQLNQIFSTFDQLLEKYELEKIKTIGDAYMAVGGLPSHRPDHAEAIANMALDMQQVISKFQTDLGDPFQLRIGINTGTVVAGVIGLKKFSYDLWGDAVNLASRMESHGIPGCIQVTPSTYQQLKEQFNLEPRGTIPVKGRGNVATYLLLGKREQ
ncbi:family 3 adenylate cyclase [Leptolyngbyaceae cyanobacterium JSC-12]|nr:family 3 adenylate cyclase [Leptolyngbyaceae cyanobacterium JSC-12]